MFDQDFLVIYLIILCRDTVLNVEGSKYSKFLSVQEISSSNKISKYKNKKLLLL